MIIVFPMVRNFLFFISQEKPVSHHFVSNLPYKPCNSCAKIRNKINKGIGGVGRFSTNTNTANRANNTDINISVHL